MILLVDIGNTRLKWCIEYKGAFDLMHAVEYQSNQFVNEIKQTWASLDSPRILALSSVASKQVLSQCINIAEQLWPGIDVFIAESSSFDLGVSNAYPQANKLGVDRWLGMIALQHYFSGNKCIIDCGTAITLDCLDDNGQHMGGLISPGIQLMKLSLSKETENLSMSRQLFPVELADNTEAAIDIGALYSAVGFIEKAINNLCACDVLVFTGGDAQLVAQNVDFNSKELEINSQPDFVLKGLALLCKGHRA